MKLLLIVGVANDIFIYNYAKWLKASMDVTIDVFEFYPSTQQSYGNEFYDSVTSAKSCGIFLIKDYIDPYINSRQLAKFVRGKKYDIIHCHWVVSPLVMVKTLKSHCQKLIVTFWGGELTQMHLLGSNKLFRKHLDKFMKEVDAVINSRASELIKNYLPDYTGAFYKASLGSAPLEELYGLMQKESKNTSKKAYNIPLDKYTVLIGYSGKNIHQHLLILQLLRQHQELKDKLHLLAPMTRGACEKYISRVKESLDTSGYTYTLISGRFLNDIEMAQLRNATDITLQLSTTDGFSRSIVECLCAKSLLIYGNWLGYDKRFEASGFEGISVKSVKEGIDSIGNVLDNFDSFSNILQSNFEKGKKQNIWSECIKDWVYAYNDLLK